MQNAVLLYAVLVLIAWSTSPAAFGASKEIVIVLLCQENIPKIEEPENTAHVGVFVLHIAQV